MLKEGIMKIKIFSFLAVLSLSIFTYTSAGAGAVKAADTVKVPNVTSQSAIVADADTGRIYYEKNIHEQLYPASITKILTGIVAVEKLSPQDVITVTDDVSSGMPSNAARICLVGGEQITAEQALYTMFLASANDSANALALKVGGTMDNFVSMMNERAKELGADESHFANANGLPDKNNVTTAYDMAIITKAAFQNQNLMKYFGATSYTMAPTNKHPKKQTFETLHKMMKNTVYKYNGTVAGKTGWETMSGHTLVTVASRNGHNLICVVMKNDGHSIYEDTIALLNYGFTQTSATGPADYLRSPVPVAAAITSDKKPAQTKTEPKLETKDGSGFSGNYAAPLLLLLSAICFTAFLLTCSGKNKRRARQRKRTTRV